MTKQQILDNFTKKELFGLYLNEVYQLYLNEGHFPICNIDKEKALTMFNTIRIKNLTFQDCAVEGYINFEITNR